MTAWASYLKLHVDSQQLQQYTHTHTHLFNGPFSRTTPDSQYQKGKTNVDFTEARDSEWQWHELGHMQVCTLLQTDNNASQFISGRMPLLSPSRQHQSTEGKNYSSNNYKIWLSVPFVVEKSC